MIRLKPATIRWAPFWYSRAIGSPKAISGLQKSTGVLLFLVKVRSGVGRSLAPTGTLMCLSLSPWQLVQVGVQGRAPLHSGAWSRATLEVCLGILDAARYEGGPPGISLPAQGDRATAMTLVAAILLGKRLGLNPAEVVRVVGDGAGSSRMLQVRGPMMASRNWKDATMKVSIWQKDMSIISDALADTLTPAPLFAASAPIYQAAQALGLGEQDTASVMAVLEHMVGDSA